MDRRAHQKTEEQAWRIEMNLEFVDQAIIVIHQAVAAGMDWEELAELVRDQQGQENPVAERITKLSLAVNQIMLSLGDPIKNSSDSDSVSDEETSEFGRGPLSVDVDIFKSAFANAQWYYMSQCQAGIKHAKTLAVSSQALQSAEQKIRANLHPTKITLTMTQQRKPLWFEKFAWFISSDGYLMLAGHDMHQNELLVKRYLRAGDAYVHADLHGAVSVVVKNRSASSPIPPSTLFQAGIMSMCLLCMWVEKIVTSASWVEAHQVSKTTQLVYGFGFLFRLANDESIARHAAARQQRLALVQEGFCAASKVAKENADKADDNNNNASAAAAVIGQMDSAAAPKKYNLKEGDVSVTTKYPE
ncbi:hypothetical protein LPJ56_002459 [Coemansia sp. RSA 2599]|nr:hypothetical protein LPJ75_002139 [Coemansia sp. RSA 2598]KAJ1825883.1 hypothetical protein LPJ56_002459 [Coemansia sp. RSA 2599]